MRKTDNLLRFFENEDAQCMYSRYFPPSEYMPIPHAGEKVWLSDDLYLVKEVPSYSIDDFSTMVDVIVEKIS